MTHVSYTELRQNLARYLDEAVASRAAITITRAAGKGNVVMISEAEFAGCSGDRSSPEQPAQRRTPAARDPRGRGRRHRGT